MNTPSLMLPSQGNMITPKEDLLIFPTNTKRATKGLNYIIEEATNSGVYIFDDMGKKHFISFGTLSVSWDIVDN